MGAGERGCSWGTWAHPISAACKPRRSGDIHCSGVRHSGLSLRLGVLLSTPILGWAGSELQGGCSPAATGSTPWGPPAAGAGDKGVGGDEGLGDGSMRCFGVG